jgi:hypothetical protein
VERGLGLGLGAEPEREAYNTHHNIQHTTHNTYKIQHTTYTYISYSPIPPQQLPQFLLGGPVQGVEKDHFYTPFLYRARPRGMRRGGGGGGGSGRCLDRRGDRDVWCRGRGVSVVVCPLCRQASGSLHTPLCVLRLLVCVTYVRTEQLGKCRYTTVHFECIQELVLRGVRGLEGKGCRG